jgi:hypothetical protein
MLSTVCTDGLQGLGHDFRAVVDGEHNIGDTSSSKSLDLVLDHGLVGELDKRLGVCEGLWPLLALPWLRGCGLRGSGASGAREGKAYERAQTGSKPSDENDG